MAPLKMSDLIEWAKVIGSSLAIIVMVVALMLIGIEITIIFSSGHMGWGFLSLAAYLVGMYFAVRYIHRP
jgi:hypothetical protein